MVADGQQTAILIGLLVFSILFMLFLVLKLKLHAFISLVITSTVVAIGAQLANTGMVDFVAVVDTLENGMGGALKSIALIIGIGAIFGEILEATGGAEVLAQTLIKKFGMKNAPYALVLAGFIIAIPVFFDVAFVILVPMVYTLSKKSGKSLLYYAIPLLAGLAVTHTFIPPTPGPIAVAQIMGVDLGWIIFFGFIVGIPTAILAGPVFGKFIASKIHLDVPEHIEATLEEKTLEKFPAFGLVASIIAIPLVLILAQTLTTALIGQGKIAESGVTNFILFLGDPIIALLISTLVAIVFLGLKQGFTKEMIMTISNKALGPAGLIILVTGAGGVFKQVLIESGIADVLGTQMSNLGLSPIVLAYLIAAVIRVAQGSATVAMTTAAGIMAPLVVGQSDPYIALTVISIASGATVLSHVNDSGFWLIGKYLGMDETQTLKSWTMMETIISLSGFAIALILSFFV